MKWYRNVISIPFFIFAFALLFYGIIHANLDKFCKINLSKITLDFFLNL